MFRKAVDQRPGLGGDLVARRHAADELAGRVHLHQMWNDSGARQCQLSLRVFWQFTLGNALGKDLLDRRVYHSLDTSEPVVARQCEFVVRSVVLVEVGKRESE